MKPEKAGSVRKAALIAVALIVLLAVHAPSAQATNFCTGSGSSSGVIPQPGSTLLSNVGSLNTILGISLAIMLMMAGISGLLYAIGYSFRINGLVRASKQEFGEIAVTALIVFVLVGTFSLTTSLANTPPALLSGTGAYSRGVFVDDCNQLSTYALTLFEYSFDLGVVQDFTILASSITVNLQPEGFGPIFTPLSGFYSSVHAIGLLFIFAGVMGGLLLAIGVALGIFYAIMPIFLFAGIILRTLPWTRAAGGAFIGLFIGFFIVFPILLHFLLYNTPASLGPGQVGPLTSGSFFDIIGALNPGAAFTIASSFASLIDPSYAVEQIIGILVPAMYGVFCFAFSFIIAFDFAEVCGDFLGSPSLSTSQSLNRLL